MNPLSNIGPYQIPVLNLILALHKIARHRIPEFHVQAVTEDSGHRQIRILAVAVGDVGQEEVESVPEHVRPVLPGVLAGVEQLAICEIKASTV